LIELYYFKKLKVEGNKAVGNIIYMETVITHIRTKNSYFHRLQVDCEN